MVKNEMILIILLLALPIAQAFNNPFDNAWIQQAKRPQIKLCICQLDNGVRITGTHYLAQWIKPECMNGTCKGIEKTWEQEVCMLSDHYDEGCYLEDGYNRAFNQMRK